MDEWKHLRHLLTRLHNRRVNRFFGEKAKVGRIGEGRSSAKTACTINRKDSAIIALTKVIFFEVTLGNASRMHPPLYSIPLSDYHETYSVTDYPICSLYFRQKNDKAEITFRLINETSEMSLSNMQSLANNIKKEFHNFSFAKGRYRIYYKDKRQGYQFGFLAKSPTVGEEMVKKILALRGHKYDSKKLICSFFPKRQNNDVSKVKFIKNRKMGTVRWRPEITVIFRWAVLTLPAYNKAIPLYDPYYVLQEPALLY